ncbi:MAG: RDD family protein [Bacteroidota bacterium]|nr:RDD family protein [Bacteroidota bacterium]
MDNIRIQTTQNVDIEYQPASVGDRILATLLDYCFFFAYFIMLGLIAAATKGAFFESIAVGVLVSLPILLYDIILESVFDGRSFGKMIMKIKVVKIDGSQASLGAFITRWLLRLVDTYLFTGVVALVTILINGKGQRLGDMAAGTTVIKTSQRVYLTNTILNTLTPDYKLVFPQVMNLSDNDIAIIKEVMSLCLRTGNFPAIERVAQKTKEVMGISSQLPHTQFLAIVVQDYSHYNFEK